ncbi:uncharacterized protein LOC106054153 isoform X1 [Biomphalaria glabrata]|uniref:Glycosyltransferase family 92 protein n=2 Tax=Biomphalaria glabrata TaxID=6526 RepID=A0A9U8DX95_BIOGL|nr:uncharacterized protein LOC106054153 isoform X1 [Biomphalaria glabrata]XP_013065363.2 uncharacterized protein LOC106054153 isoform X1 [Biomphalaria glabrata]KAI8750475.1 glycosyltransferase family 92 protein F13G3.3 [Biomphalaria glabrata]
MKPGKRKTQIGLVLKQFKKSRCIAVSFLLGTLALTLYNFSSFGSMVSRQFWPEIGKVVVSEQSHQVLVNLSRTIHRSSDDLVKPPGDVRFQRLNIHDLWLFSAFYDKISNKNLVRIFGLQDTELNDPVMCYLIEANETYRIYGTRQLLVDYHGNRLRVVSFECEINPTSKPNFVSLTFTSENTLPTNSLEVLYSLPSQRNFTVCYAALFNFTNYRQIIQNVEFNRVLGAEHFFVYNMSISSATDIVLRHYQKRGLMTVIQWPLPASEIHYNGQVLAINDCVYRNKGISKYVVIQDTDEFIIPNHHDTWGDLIHEINQDYDLKNNCSTSHEQIGTYIVESTFFQEMPTREEFSEIKQHYFISDRDETMFQRCSLTVFTNLVRMNQTFGDARQKSIVRPEMVLFPDVHTTIVHRPSATDVLVNESLALVHHQRFYSASGSILDTSSLRFKDAVIPLVRRTLYSLSKQGLQF